MVNNWNQVNVNKIMMGDVNEITLLYDMMMPWLNYLTKNEEHSHDIFLKVINSIYKYKNHKGQLKNFIYTICINENSVLKREKKRKIDILYVETYSECDLFDNFDDDEFIDCEVELYKLTVHLSYEDQQFLAKYIHSTYKKNGKDKTRFSKIKKKLKEIYERTAN
jgi:DNA-directed RNA polymerase specialized sigma24 family protein